MTNVRNPVAVAALSLAIVAAACSDSPVAPAPPPLTSTSSPPPQPSGPASASLVIEDFAAIVKRSSTDGRGVPVEDGWFAIEVRFLLRETGGTSGATVESFFLGDETGGGAWFAGFCVEGVRVPPGGVYDTLNTDEGYKSWGYCAPYLGRRQRADQGTSDVSDRELR
jgi:hypothetical protein